MLTRPYQLLLIAVIVLAAFYPSNFAGFAPIDDEDWAASHRNVKGMDLEEIFVPKFGGGLYYRPVIALSFRIDKLLHGFDPGIMHLENVLIHIINALLVFFIAFRLVIPHDRAGSLLPLFVSLVFALHPVNAESVNWISGRSDLLAGSFLFASMLFVLSYRDDRRRRTGILSFVLFLGAVLTKETSLAFLPGVFLVLTAPDGPGTVNTVNTMYPQQRIDRNRRLIVSGVLFAIGVFFFLRGAAFTSNSSRIGLTVMAMTDDWIHSMFVILRTFGFYMKKLICPLPLNFAIIEVDPLYEILAVPVLLICAFIVIHRTTLAAIFTTGLLLIVPSFLIAFGQIAWMPYAERYLYLASAFLLLTSIIASAKVVPDRALNAARAGAVAVILLLCGLTFQRSLIWQNEMTLIVDTVEKTPDSRMLRAIYALKLARRGDYVTAQEQLDKVRDVRELEYDPRYDFIRAYIFYRQGKIDESLAVMESVEKRTKGRSAEALGYLVLLLQDKKKMCRSQTEIIAIERLIFKHTLRQYALTGHPHLLYDLGVSAQQLGDRQRAVRLFRQAKNNLPDSDPLHRASLHKIDILSGREGAYRGKKTASAH